jgi:hypothetical protein
VTWASAPKIRSERIFILLHPLTVHVRICQAAKDLPARRRSIFYLLDAYVRLREQFFRLGFLVVQPVTGKIPCVVCQRRFRRNSLARNPYAKALVISMASVFRMCMRLSDLHVALL